MEKDNDTVIESKQGGRKVTKMEEVGNKKLVNRKVKKKYIQLKEVTKIGTWNVRTLYQAGNLEQLLKEVKRYNIEILGLSEVRWTGQGELKVGKYKIVYSGTDENEGEHQRGVAFVLNQRANEAMLEWEPIDERLIRIRISLESKKMTIIQCYAPTEVAEYEDKEIFYSKLNGVMRKIPKNDIIILMGDFNARVGSNNNGVEEVMGREGIDNRNENGELMVELCGMYNLKIGGTMFTHKRCHKVTWTSPDGNTESQIDHICVSHKNSKMLRDTRNQRGADIGSDHYLLLAKFNLNIGKVKTRYLKTKREIYDTKKAQCEGIRQKFTQTLREKRLNIDYTKPIEVVWNKCKDALLETGKETLGLRSYDKKEWLTDQTWKLIEERRKIKHRKLRECSEDMKKEIQNKYNKIAAEIKRSIRRDKRKFIQRTAEEAQRAASIGDTKTVYKKIREIGRRRKTSNIIKGKDGNILTNTEEQLERWAEYFRDVLNIKREGISRMKVENQIPELDIKTEPPSMGEIIEAINKLKKDKAPGIDEITGDLLKVDIQNTAELLHPLFIKIWQEERFPEDWKKGIIIKLPKKGDLKNCTNWRGITLLSTVNKLFCRILVNRMKVELDKDLRKEQHGFRSGRSCTDLINTLRIITEHSMEYQSPLCLAFIDFEKAFDSINRENIWIVLRNRGVPQKIINLIKEGYNQYKSIVKHEGKLSQDFETETGVKQGCVLSPILFTLVLDEVMKTAISNKKGGIPWKLMEKLEDLDFADDICLISDKIHKLQERLCDLSSEGKKIGLKINIEKTKVIYLNTDSNQEITLEGNTIEEVKEFNYLGSIIAETDGVLKDVNNRTNKARAVFMSLNKTWRSNNLTLQTKIKVFNSMVKPVLLYGSESWTLTKAIEQKLQVFTNRCLRNILQVWWPKRISNEDLWQRTGEEPIGNQIKRRKFGWLGHTLRKEKDEIPRRALQWHPEGKRKSGRPKETWTKKTQREAGMSLAEMGFLAKDRRNWKKFTNSLCPKGG